MAEKQYTLEEIQGLASALGLSAGQKNDVFSTTLTNQALYSVNPGNTAQNGVFTGAGVRPGMFNATARTRSFTNAIPFNRSVLWNELLEILTGVTASAGTNSTSSCAAAPTPGVLKTMRVAYTFGMINMDTRTFDITQAGARYDRAVMDRDIYNAAMVNNPFIPQLPGIEGNDVASNEVRAAMYTLGKAVEDAVSQVSFVGVAATSDNTYPGVATQWAGLNALITTGYTDSVTGLASTVVDSDVQTFAKIVTGTDTYGRDIVRALNDLVYGLRERARQVGLVQPTYAAVMRGDLFREITRIWAEKLAFYHVTGAAATPVSASGMELQMLRREMQAGNYLILDDNSLLPVIIDDAQPRRTTANNQYHSDIFIVALEAGGIPLVRFEYFDMNNATAQELAALGTPGHSMVINNGLYRMFRFETGGCLHWKVVARPRMILDAPFLHGRLDRVEYNVYWKEQDPIPGFSYHRDGGVSYRPTR